jgi:hypothetical protein
MGAMRKTLWMVGAFLLLPLAVWLGAQVGSPKKALAEIMPANAMVYVEAKNFGGLVSDWNASLEKKTWLESGTYQSYLRSKLALRLEEVQKAYADGIGVNPNYALLENVAGGESGLAMYDIGKLELLYATRLPSARLAENLLMQARTKFQARNAGGQQYFVKSTTDGTVAFAVAGELLIAGTREDLVAASLLLLSGQQGRTAMKQERWYTEAIAKAAPAAPDLRMVVNMERTVKAPHFRSYWIQQNISEHKQYFATVSDLQMGQATWTEQRVLLRSEAAQAVEESGVATLSRLIPADAGFYQAWAKPSAPAVEDLLVSRFTSRTVPSAVNPADERAPGESAVGWSGSEEDLERRIDVVEPGLKIGSATWPIAKLAAATTVDAAAQIAGSRTTADGVFVAVDSAIVLLGSANWDENAVKAAAQASAEQAWSATSLTWTRRGAVSELSGLMPIQLWVDGKVLVIGNAAGLMDRIAARGGVAQSGSYVAGYRQGAENSNYARIMRMIDYPQIPTGENRAPMLFSENLAGIGRILGRVDSVTVATKDEGALVRQSVVYRKRSQP